MLLTFMTKPDRTMVGVAPAKPRLRRSARSPVEWTDAGCIVLPGSPEVSVTQSGHVQVPSGWIAL
jgi:hypothetical protein